jgi:uncharacterized protein
MESSFPNLLIGMVHLLPLPGSPNYGGTMDEICAAAINDALALKDAGFDALLIENYGDAPFRKETVEPLTVAAMTSAVTQVRREVSLPVGVQVLRNDAQAGLSIAAVSGAQFVRVNVHTGAMLTDQGIIEGKADETLRLRTALGVQVKIFADVFVKHATPLGTAPIKDAARDAAERGLADALIVSGSATGSEINVEDLHSVKSSVDIPVIVGSGVNADSVKSLLAIADGVIVGTAIKEHGITTAPVDPERAKAFVEAVKL